jgi:hypothetical protein
MIKDLFDPLVKYIKRIDTRVSRLENYFDRVSGKSKYSFISVGYVLGVNFKDLVIDVAVPSLGIPSAKAYPLFRYQIFNVKSKTFVLLISSNGESFYYLGNVVYGLTADEINNFIEKVKFDNNGNEIVSLFEVDDYWKKIEDARSSFLNLITLIAPVQNPNPLPNPIENNEEVPSFILTEVSDFKTEGYHYENGSGLLLNIFRPNIKLGYYFREFGRIEFGSIKPPDTDINDHKLDFVVDIATGLFQVKSNSVNFLINEDTKDIPFDQYKGFFYSDSKTKNFLRFNYKTMELKKLVNKNNNSLVDIIKISKDYEDQSNPRNGKIELICNKQLSGAPDDYETGISISENKIIELYSKSSYILMDDNDTKIDIVTGDSRVKIDDFNGFIDIKRNNCGISINDNNKTIDLNIDNQSWIFIDDNSNKIDIHTNNESIEIEPGIVKLNSNALEIKIDSNNGNIKLTAGSLYIDLDVNNSKIVLKGNVEIQGSLRVTQDVKSGPNYVSLNTHTHNYIDVPVGSSVTQPPNGTGSSV